MGVVFIKSTDVIPEDGPEGICETATERGAMKEGADAGVAISAPPDAGGEEGQKTGVDELLKPDF